jgi:hypothetical protein
VNRSKRDAEIVRTQRSLRSRFGLSSAALAAALAWSGCEQTPAGAISVDISTGLVPGPEFRFVTVEAFEGANRIAYYEAPATYGQPYSRESGFRVAQLQLPTGPHRVTVRLLRADRRLLVGFTKLVNVDASPHRAYFRLDRDCVGDVVCPSPGGSSALTECLGGSCVDERCEPPDTTFCPNVTFCNADSDCAPPAACATVHCDEGLCVEEARAAGQPGACAATEYCHPSLGCQSQSTPAEVETPQCGEFCETDCEAGLWVCSGTPRCSVVSYKDAGIPCGMGRVCDGAGSCMAVP